jgi:hypothetical protein
LNGHLSIFDFVSIELHSLKMKIVFEAINTASKIFKENVTKLPHQFVTNSKEFIFRSGDLGVH